MHRAGMHIDNIVIGLYQYYTHLTCRIPRRPICLCNDKSPFIKNFTLQRRNADRSSVFIGLKTKNDVVLAICYCIAT